MTIVLLFLFGVACGIAKKVLGLALSIPVSVIAASWWFDGGAMWVACGLISSLLLGSPLAGEMWNAPGITRSYGKLFDMLGMICIIIGIIKML